MRGARWPAVRRASTIAAACAAIVGAAPQRGAPAPPPIATHPLPPATIDNDLAVGGEAIGARTVATRMTVAIRINDQGPFRFVVDSGADSSVIASRIARAVQLPAGTPAMLHGMTASGRVDRVKVDRLNLGQTVISDLELPVLEEKDLGAEGIIGIDALVEQRLMLDFEKRIIKVEDARQAARRLDGEIVVVARRRRGQLILTQAYADGKPVNAVIDTGSELTIGNQALRDRLLRRYAGRVEKVEATGVTGASMTLDLVRVAELQLGPVVLRDVPIAFADVPPFAVFGLADRPALLLGTDLMATFRRVSLDFRGRRVRFQLRHCEPEGLMVGTSTASSLISSPSRLMLANDGSGACRR